MAVLVSDPFNSMAVGPGVPPGWSLVFEFSIAAVDDYSGSLTSRIGQYPGNNWYTFGAGGELLSPVLEISGIPVNEPSVTLFFGWRSVVNGLGSFTSLDFFGALTSLSQGLLCKLVGNADGSISAITADGVFICNSGIVNEIYFSQKEWYFFQVNLDITSVGGFVVIDITVASEGKEIMSGSATSGIAASTFLSPIGVDQFGVSAGASGFFDVGQFTLETQVALATTNPSTFPNPFKIPPDTGPDTQIHQGVIEWGKAPTDSEVVMHHGLIEYGKHPTDSKVIIHHMVIEVATTGGGTPVMPEYVRRRNTGI